MPDHVTTTQAKLLGADVTATTAVEYALIAAMIVFSIVVALEVIGGQSQLGLPPIIEALQAAVAS